MNKQSGIYRVRRVATGKLYVGSSVDLDARWYQHRMLLRLGTHHNIHLQHAWDKHGADAFVFEIVELVSPDHLIEREQYWMDQTRCYEQEYGYNLAPAAGRGTGRPITIPSFTLEETIERLDACLARKPALAPVHLARAALAHLELLEEERDEVERIRNRIEEIKERVFFCESLRDACRDHGIDASQLHAMIERTGNAPTPGEALLQALAVMGAMKEEP